MAVNTVEDIEDILDGSLSWRRIELHALKGAISDAERRSPDSPLARALSRSGVAMLYAHWEGFVKEACQAYVDYVARRKLKCHELNDGFLQTVLMALNKRAMAGDEVGTNALLEAVRRTGESRARIPKNSIVDTKSNLRFNVLADIFGSIGFAVDKFATRDKLIDRTLCDGRNSIAHGRYYYPGAGSFEELNAEVLAMMEDLRDLILSSARMQAYRSPTDANN